MVDKMSDDEVRSDILSVMDNFIEKIQSLRKIMLGVSISAVVLAPFAIGLSAYLFLHPSFFSLLELENEFGIFLSVLLGGIIIVSGIWLYTGLKQYVTLSNWNQRYTKYMNKKSQLDSSISSLFNLD